MAIDKAADAILPRVVAWRRDFHEHPELGNDEYHLVQKTILQGQTVQDGANNLIYVFEEGQQVVVVKATKSGETSAVRL